MTDTHEIQIAGSETREINLLMSKFNNAIKTIGSKVETRVNKLRWVDKEISISEFPRYKALVKRNKIKYKRIKYGDAFWETYYKIDSFVKTSKLDRELFDLLNVGINIEKWDRNKDYIGQMSTSGKMKIVNSKYQVTNTTAHEFGHAWQMQLSKKMGFGLNRYILDTLRFYLDLCGYKPDNDYKGFKRIKGGIGYHITRYAKSNPMEAFAELFMIAYGEIWWESKQLDKWLKRRGHAQKAIKFYNNTIKTRFIEEETGFKKTF